MRPSRHINSLIENSDSGMLPLSWTVVESIPVHEDIKLARPKHERYVDNWIASMENLAACGVKVICYNFMPVIDWTRTDLKFQLSSGAFALRFDQHKFAAFDLFILQRAGADADYSEQEITQARQVFDSMSESERNQLTSNIIAGLPGKMSDAYSLDDFGAMLDNYRDISRDDLRANLIAFLAKVLPRAETLGVKLAIHPRRPAAGYVRTAANCLYGRRPKLPFSCVAQSCQWHHSLCRHLWQSPR